MSIVTDLTPTQYSLIRIGLQQEGTIVVAIADMMIYNADGRRLATHNLNITLTSDEEKMLTSLVDRELSAIETKDRLTKYVPPEEPIP